MIASLVMFKDCIDRCPQTQWNESHKDFPFSQVAFHTLFDCDYVFSENAEELKEQDFHRKNRNTFGEYEELEGKIAQRLYEHDFINAYYEYCKVKSISAISKKTLDEMMAPKSDVYKTMTKMERYMNAIRHVQHHTAQLGLRLQFITGIEMEWIGRGYEK